MTVYYEDTDSIYCSENVTTCKEPCLSYTHEQIAKAPEFIRVYLTFSKRICNNLVINGKCKNEKQHI